MVRWYVGSVAALVVVVALLTGPLVGLDVTDPRATEFGEGAVSATTVSVAADGLRVTDGRFGTGVEYLRVPPATVEVGSVTDRPRLVYAVSVPALDLELVATAVVTGPGTYRLAPGDRGLAAGTAGVATYDATLTVRAQSFSGDERLYREPVTVEVAT